jgi:hypothetical protein
VPTDEAEALARAIEGGIKAATPKLARAAIMLRELARERDALREQAHGR